MNTSIKSVCFRMIDLKYSQLIINAIQRRYGMKCYTIDNSNIPEHVALWTDEFEKYPFANEIHTFISGVVTGIFEFTNIVWNSCGKGVSDPYVTVPLLNNNGKIVFGDYDPVFGGYMDHEGHRLEPMYWGEVSKI